MNRTLLPAATAIALVGTLIFGAVPATADDLPVETPVAETPVVETPVVETPVVEEPAEAPVVVETPAEAPGAPAAPLTIVLGTDSVSLSWLPTADSEWEVLVYAPDAALESAVHPLDSELDPAFTTSLEPAPEGTPLGTVIATLTGLAPETAYEFVVRAVGSDVLSERSEVVTTLAVAVDAPPAEAPTEAGPAAKPEAVTPAPLAVEEEVEAPAAASMFLRAAAAATAPTITVKGATSVVVDYAAYAAVASVGNAYPYYTVTAYRVTDDTVAKTQAVLTASTMVVTGLTAGTSYYFDVQEAAFVDAAGPSAAATTFVSAVAPGVIPAVPTAEVISSTVIKASWPAIEEGAEVKSYTARIYQAGVLKTTKIGIDPYTLGTSWEFTGLLAATAYTVTVTAVGYDLTGVESAPSAPATTAKGAPLAPAAPTLARASTATTGLTATWAAPINDGGYPITGYRLELYNPGSIATAQLVQAVQLPATQTSFTFPETYIVGSAMVVRVAAVSAAGVSAFSGVSSAITVAATAVPATAVVSNTVKVSAPTADGFTLKWTPPASATASTGYLVRIVEKLASNPAATTNYTSGILDLGRDWPTTGEQTTSVTGLEGGRTYAVAITAYNEAVDGTITFRTSTGRSALITTAGSSVPHQPIGKAPTPVVLGIDSISWTGVELGTTYTGGSAVTGYWVQLYESGSVTPVATTLIPTTFGSPPTTTFTGLTRDTFYQVRYAGVNANGTGQLSEISDGARTLSRPAPGSVAPVYTTLADVRAAITATDVTEISATSIDLDRTIESNTTISFSTVWTGAATEGEAWLYGEQLDAAFRGTFTIAGGTATVTIPLGDLATDSYTLVLYAEGDTPVAVELDITKPISGPTELDDAVFRWGINGESQNGAFFGGCNFLSAGKSASAGSAKVFSSSQYSAQGTGVDENVTIEKPNASGDYQLATWESKCLTRSGTPVTSSVNTAFTESQVVITGGEGVVDPSTNSADIQWTGSFTIAFYGGLTFWYATDPRLTVVDGVGTLTATASGYGTDMDDQTKWEELEPQQITLGTLHNVKLTSAGFSVTPDYLGVAVTVPDAPQAAKSGTNAAFWGSFPQDYVDFQALTGQGSYWYSSGGTQDKAKPTLPLYVGYDAANFEDPDTGSGDGTGEGVEQPNVQTPPPAQKPLKVKLASPTSTSVDSLETLAKLIEEGTILSADGGFPTSFQIGDRLDFDLAWTGADVSGAIWLYPEVMYAGSFAVVDGRVTISIDSSVFTVEGEKHFVFFGDAGTSVSAASLASGFRAPVTTTSLVDDAAPQQAAAAAIAAPDAVPTSPLVILLIAGLGVIVLAAGVGGVLVLRRR